MNVTSPDTQKNLKNAREINHSGVFFCFKFSMSVQCLLLRCFYDNLKKIKNKNVIFIIEFN